MSTQKRLFTAMTPSFCSLTDTKQSLQYTIKTHLSGPPMPKFEANMNYIPPSPPSSMKQCNKSATVKFHMELLLTTTTRKQSRSGATPKEDWWYSVWNRLIDYFRLFIVATGCPSERRPQKTVSCYGG